MRKLRLKAEKHSLKNQAGWTNSDKKHHLFSKDLFMSKTWPRLILTAEHYLRMSHSLSVELARGQNTLLRITGSWRWLTVSHNNRSAHTHTHTSIQSSPFIALPGSQARCVFSIFSGILQKTRRDINMAEEMSAVYLKNTLGGYLSQMYTDLDSETKK